MIHGSLSRNGNSAESFEQSYSDWIGRIAYGDMLGLSTVSAAAAYEPLLRKRDLNRAFVTARKKNRELDFQSFAAACRRSSP